MSAINTQVMGHLVRRGLEAVTMTGSPRQRLESLPAQAELYEESPHGEVQPWEVLVIAFTAIAYLALYASVCSFYQK